MNDFAKEFCGLRLIETTAITKTVQRRTHKKRRINKKWAKRYGYKKIPDDNKIMVAGGYIFGTPKMINRIKHVWKGKAHEKFW